jgi:hypothetical protein
MPYRRSIATGFGEARALTWCMLFPVLLLFSSQLAMAALSITSTSPLPAGTTAVPYSYTFAASGGTGALNWTIISGTAPNLTLSASGVLSGIPQTPGLFQITVRVTDGTNTSVTGTFAIPINSAVLQITSASPLPPAAAGTPYSFQFGATGGAGAYSWTITGGALPSGLAMNSAGQLSGTPTLPQVSDFIVQVADGFNSVALQQFRLIVNGPLSLACPSSSAVVGSPYTSALTATGGLAPYQFSLQAGSLPPGLALSASTGGISGTPSQAGVFSATFRVQDSSGTGASTSCSIQVSTQGGALSLGCPTGAGVVGSPYLAMLPVSGGQPPYTFSVVSGALPAGLALNTQTGSVSGTPSAPGSFVAQFRVQDSAGEAETASCSLRIDPATALQLTGACSAEPYPNGLPMGVLLVASGGDGIYSYRVDSPSWASIEGSGANVRLTGIPPNPGSYVLSVVVSDSSGAQASFTCGFQVAQSLSLSVGCPADSVPVSVPLALPLSILGGSGPYQWSLVSGPSWLRLETNTGSTNRLTGTPPSAGGYSYTVSVTDAIDSLAAVNTCNLQVGSSTLGIVSGGCPTERPRVGIPFSVDLEATGGTSVYRWDLTGPSWLTITQREGSRTSLAGTPPAGGLYNFTITLSDDLGATTQLSCQLDVIPALEIRGQLPELVKGQPFLSTLEAQGGQGPFSWSFTGPAWITLDTTVGPKVTLSGTPPAAGPFDCSITLSDGVGSAPASFNCSVSVGNPALRIEALPTACPVAITLGTAFAANLGAVGGDGTYTWVFTGPSWLTASGTSGPTLTISGTPDLAGNTKYNVELRDASGTLPSTKYCEMTVVLPVFPSISVVGLKLGDDVLQPVTVGLELDGPAPSRMDGEVQLSFASTGFGTQDNPQVQFLDPAATDRGRRLRFSIPKGASSLALGQIQPGTVSGNLRVEMIDLTAGGSNILPTVLRPSGEMAIPKQRPAILDLNFESETANGFTVVATGYSTPRDMSTATLTISPRSRARFTGPTSFTVPVTDVFNQYYSSSASQIGGSSFVFRIPVTVSGNKNDIGSVSLRLTNSIGDSETSTRSR